MHNFKVHFYLRWFRSSLISLLQTLNATCGLTKVSCSDPIGFNRQQLHHWSTVVINDYDYRDFWFHFCSCYGDFHSPDYSGFAGGIRSNETGGGRMVFCSIFCLRCLPSLHLTSCQTLILHRFYGIENYCLAVLFWTYFRVFHVAFLRILVQDFVQRLLVLRFSLPPKLHRSSFYAAAVFVP